MVFLNLSGVPIEFPFQPYDVQEKFMEKVIECLQKGVNGLLESPTGTGKTLCLLCSCLGWLTTRKAQVQSGLLTSDPGVQLKNQLSSATGLSWGDTPGNGGVPKIIYASRTHSQLSQVISELKRSSYKFMKVSILGSRDQLCIHPEVSKEQNNAIKLHMCHARTTTRSCFYHTNLEVKKEEPDFREPVLDIEDLAILGKKHSVCPYFMTKEIRKSADIIFMPYNYLLDPKVRKIHNIELQGNIIIFDEGHNVEKMCEESASIELRSVDIALCVDEVTQVMKKFRDTNEDSGLDFSSSTPKDFNVDDLCILKAMFLELEKAIDNIPLKNSEGETLPGEFMLELLSKADLNPNKKDVILDLLDRVIQYLTVSSTSPYQRRGNGLQKFADLVKIVFSKNHFTVEHMERVKKSYKVHVKVEQPKTRPGKSDSWAVQSPKIGAKAGRVLSYWCFSPGFGMRDLVEEGARCIILTSGTLSPLSSFAAELQVPFPVTLENPHIIGSNQVLVGVVTHGPDGTLLESSYKNRDNAQYVQSLGRTIRSVAQVVPDGLLVFFPSYPVMKSCQEAWQLSGLWDAINQVKPVFVEPTSKEGFQAVMTGYYATITEADRKGGCFMAVCRGKVSEGLDFCDGNGRAVIITGLPYPPSRDPRVLEKQKYLEDNMKASALKGLSGQEWYRLEATRAVNQAIGRVIRHRMDYGAILLCDQRFSNVNLVRQLSAWVRPRLQTFPKIGPLLRDLGQFFRNAELLFPHTAKPLRAPTSADADPSETGKKVISTVDSRNHAFSTGASKVPSNSSKTNNLQSVAAVDLISYSTSSKTVLSKPALPDAADIFGGSQSTVIDFNDVAAAASASGTDQKPTNGQPLTKKRKITIISAAEKAKYDRRKLAGSLAATTTVTTGSGSCPTSEQMTSSIHSSQDKKISAADYLKKVKGSLKAERYSAFSQTTRTYKTEKNFDVLVASLKDIFLQGSLPMPQLFRGIKIPDSRELYHSLIQDSFNSF